jgi:hypothetical protein
VASFQVEMRAPLAAAAALLAAATACAASSAGAAKPALSVSRGKLHGTHFASGEMVRVTIVRPGEDASRRMRASASGTFATTLPPGKCLGTIVVIARGSTGDSARLRLPERSCAPALRPPPSG